MNTLFFNGNFITLNPKTPFCSWVLIQNKFIHSLGVNEPPKTGDNYLKIDLQKQFVTPGLEDGHVHFQTIGSLKSIVNLTNLTSKKQVIEKIKDALKTDKNVLWGRGWDTNLWLEKNFSISDLPKTDRPIILFRIDGHALIANNIVLQICNINSNTPSPFGGEIQKDSTNTPTGILINNAMDIVTQKFKLNNDLESENAFLIAEKELLSNGIVKIHDMGIDKYTNKILIKLYGEKKLKIKTHAYFNTQNKNVLLNDIAIPTKINNYELAGIKLYLDGSFGSQSASLTDGYKNTTRKGLLLISDSELIENIEYAIKNNIAIAAHAIGNGGVKMFLKNLKAFDINDVRKRRFRLEHASMVDDDDLNILEQYGIIPSIQPCHFTSDIKWLHNVLTKNQIEKTYKWKDLLEKTKILSIGTDAPIEPIDPIRNFTAALSREEQSLNPIDILEAYTKGNAYCSFKENKRGMIKEGYDADFTLFSENPLDCNYNNLKITNVIIDGSLYY